MAKVKSSTTPASERGNAKKVKRAEALATIKQLRGNDNLNATQVKNLLIALVKWLGLDE